MIINRVTQIAITILMVLVLYGCSSQPKQMEQWSNPKYPENAESVFKRDSLLCRDSAYIESQKIYVPDVPRYQGTPKGASAGVQRGIEIARARNAAQTAEEVKVRLAERVYYSCMDELGWRVTAYHYKE